MAIDNNRKLLLIADNLNNRVMIFKKNDPEINIRQEVGYSPSGTFFDFGTQSVGSETTLTFYIDNSGNSDLILSGSPIITITGADADQFSVKTQQKTRLIGKWRPLVDFKLGYRKLNDKLAYGVKKFDNTIGYKAAMGIHKGRLDFKVGYESFTHDKDEATTGSINTSSELDLSGFFCELSYSFSSGRYF